MRTIDDILSTNFGRKAVETGLVLRNGNPCAANFLRELLEEVDKLAQYCQISEFTEHGIRHLASLVNRIQTWTRADGTLLLDLLTNDEVFLLFFAVLSHDIGMLAQLEKDLEEEDRLKYARVFADLPLWVRRTHIARLEGILQRCFKDRFQEFVNSRVFTLGASLARSHQYWPDEDGYQEMEHLATEAGFVPERVKAMAGVLAVADLLDEDSGRCDTMTLFANKAGNLMNRAHWLRHLLTQGPLQVDRGVVTVQIRLPTNLEGKVDAALEGLRNHLRLAQVYNTVLGTLGAQISLNFPEAIPYDAVPNDSVLEVLMCEPDVHLMRTLPKEALPRANEREPAGSDVDVLGVRLKRVDCTVLDHAMGKVGTESGRSDLEITYAAASLRGEQERRRALDLLRSAAIESNARGDITLVRRLSSLVLEDLSEHKDRPLTDAFWAAAYTLHWASHEHDLLSVEHLLKRRAEDGEILKGQWLDKVLTKLPLEWYVLALTTQLLLLRRRVTESELTATIKRRLEFRNSSFSPEEQIAWHDLIEAFWATGYLATDNSTELSALFGELQQLERIHFPDLQHLLVELAWRMAVQSHCLRGYGRWEAQSGSMDRADYALLPDPAREAIAKVWTAWFHGCGNDLKVVARQARMSNPPGSELYVAALEAEWLVSNIDIDARMADDDNLHRRLEFRDAKERDDAYRLINSCVTSLLDVSMAPKKEGTVYLGGRNAELLRYEAILGERISLRRWCLGSWHKVVGYNVRTMLSLARTMHLEGDKVVRPVLDGIRDLPWGIPYAGKSKDLLEDLVPRVEPHITDDDLAPVLEAMARSPRRIGNIRHPGLKILGDALTSEMLPILIEWTVRELQDSDTHLWPSTFEVWPDLMEHANLPPELWQRLTSLLDHALGRILRGDTNAKIVQAAITWAPWSVAGPLVRRIADALNQADINPDWVEAAKAAVGNGLLQRHSEEWYETEEHQILVEALRHLATMSKDSENQTLLKFLSGPTPTEGYDHIAERWFERLEAVRDRAVARKDTRSISFGIPGYPVGPSRSISDEMALCSAKALDELWAAENATIEEIEVGTSVAGYLFRASRGAGREALARSLLSAMDSDRTAIGFFAVEREACVAIAWHEVANHSAHFPEDCLPELRHLLMHRLTDLPLKVVWAQARFAVEILLRSDASEDQQLAQSALLAIRARTVEQPNWGAQALVSSVTRMLEDENWPPRAEAILELFAAWAEDTATVPDPQAREAVARICRKLAKRVTGPLGDRLTRVINRLRKDVRMRVRRAAEDTE